jgi:hypothetical protein
MAELEFFDVASEPAKCNVTRMEDLPSQPGSPFRDRILHIEAADGLRLPVATRTLWQRRVAGPVPHGTWEPYDRLDNEIRIGLHLVRRFGFDNVPAEISCLVGYDVDADQPFALLLPYAGNLAQGVAGRLTLEQQRAFQAGFFRALRILEAAGVVHRHLSPQTVRWDGQAGQAQLVDFSRAVLAGEPRTAVGPSPWASPDQTSGGGIAGPGDDIWGAGALAYYVTTGRMLVPDKAGEMAIRGGALQSLLEGVFAGSPASRPSAAELLQRLHEPEPWLGHVEANSRFTEGKDEYDQLMAEKWPPPPPPPPPPQVPPGPPGPPAQPSGSRRQAPPRAQPRRAIQRQRPIRKGRPPAGRWSWQIWFGVFAAVAVVAIIAMRIL